MPIKKNINVVCRSISAAIALMFPHMLSQRGFVSAQDEQIQVIELAAKKYEYSPAPSMLKRGPKFDSKLPPQTMITVSKSRLFRKVRNRAANLG